MPLLKAFSQQAKVRHGVLHRVAVGSTQVRQMSGRVRRQVARQGSINSGSFVNDPVDVEQEEIKVKKSLVGGNVHGSYNAKRDNEKWLKRPLFARQGRNVLFKGGDEAARLLVDEARRRDPYQADYLQCVEEIATDVASTIDQNPRFAWVFKQMMEPERLITFRVPWQDDNGNARINRGYRIQYSSALGPYRGGLRFHPHMSHGSVRMLGLEQTFKNALTGFGFGGSKGGSDFDPVNKSQAEIKRFCDSFMTELAPFVGPNRDTLEGGRGVGPFELDTLYKRYVEVTGTNAAASDHDALFGSVSVFPEASGFGAVYLADCVVRENLNDSLENKRCGISGAGRVATSTAAKLIELGAKVVTLSDETGYLYDENGFDMASLEQLSKLRAHRKEIEQYVRSSPTTKFVDVTEGSLWENVELDYAFPAAIHGEVNSEDAAALAKNGCKALFEIADSACTTTAKQILSDQNVLFAPSKLVSTGSVVTSGLLLTTQSPQPISKQVMDEFLQVNMSRMLENVNSYAQKYDQANNLRLGANVMSFLRLAQSPMYLPGSPMYSQV